MSLNLMTKDLYIMAHKVDVVISKNDKLILKIFI